MSVNVNVDLSEDGLDKFLSNLKKVEGKHNVQFKELFPDSFMQQYTDCQSVSDFFEKSGLDFSSQESFQKIDVKELDGYISQHSKFSSWDEMKAEAGKLYISNQLNS